MNVGVNKQMAPPVPPAKTCGGKKEVRLNSMPWFHGKVCRSVSQRDSFFIAVSREASLLFFLINSLILRTFRLQEKKLKRY